MTLDKTLSAINKRHGDGSVMLMGENPSFEVERVSTGILPLDMALSGGFPLGRIMEVYGWESSGKTTLGLYMIKEIQKLGKTAAILDIENALDPWFAANVVGVDIDKLIISQPSSAEQAFEILLMLVESGEVDFIVFDSVSALTPKAELEGAMGDAHMGIVARLMAQAMRKLNQMQTEQDSKCTVMFINQLREKIGVMFGDPKTTTGGNSLKFYASVRIETNSPDTRKAKVWGGPKGEDVVGKKITAKVVKNKVGPPFRNAVFDLMFPDELTGEVGGINFNEGLLTVAVQMGQLTVNGSHYYDAESGEKLANGKPKAIEYLDANPEYAEGLAARLFA